MSEKKQRQKNTNQLLLAREKNFRQKKNAKLYYLKTLQKKIPNLS